MIAYRTLRYYGGRRGYGIGKWIADLLPWEKDSCYLEPFAGMAVVMLARPPVKFEMLNDRNSRLINWWRMVRDCPDEFGYLVEHTPRSRYEFAWACAAVDDLALPDIRRALTFHILVSESIISGDGRISPSAWRRAFNPATGSVYRHNSAAIARLAERMGDVQLENTDAL